MALILLWRARFTLLLAFIIGMASLAVFGSLLVAPPAYTGRLSDWAGLAFLGGTPAPLPAQDQPKEAQAESGENSEVQEPSENQLPQLTLEQRQRKYWPVVRRLAQEHNLDPALVMALIQVESKFRPRAVSRRGAVGLMQILPETGKALGIANIHDPHTNLEAGIRYLAWLKKIFNNNQRLVLAAYNAGPTKVLEMGRVPSYRETRGFVTKVLARVDHFRDRFESLARN